MMSSLHGFKNPHTRDKLKLGKKLFFIFAVLLFSFHITEIQTSFAADPYTLKKAMKDTAVDAKDGDTDLRTPKFLPVAKKDTEKPEETLSNVIQRATNYLTALAGGVAILFIVISAGKLVFALGSSDEITKAKKGLMWAIGGLVLIMFSFVITKTVISLIFSGG